MDEHGAAGDLHDPKYESIIYLPPMQGGELRAEFAAHVAEFIATRPTDEVYRRGQAIGMPWGPVRRPEQNLDDPHWEDRGFWFTAPLHGFDENVRYPGAPYRFLKTPLEFRTPAPRLGEHTRQLLADLGGLSPAQMDEAFRDGVASDVE
jgi:crotonobetainyl-CoA:carnitine CoA-transferase CaiB-like acyl-CoA transferase